MSLHVTHQRIVSRGELPGSDGGIYNPGAVWRGDRILLLCRREIDYRFSASVYPECVVVNPATFAVERHWTLRKGAGLHRRRVEDFRCLQLNDSTFVIHTRVNRDGIRPVLSRLDGRRLELLDELSLPLSLARAEKNWVLFAGRRKLYLLYKLDPLTILERDRGGRWRLVKEESNGWQSEHEGMISNSANLIPYGGGWLGFWHTQVHRRYVQGAFLLGLDLSLRARTGVLLDGLDVCDGFKPGVLYVSALLRHDNRLLAFYGEADSHVGVAIFDADEIAAELDRSPFPAVDVLRRRGGSLHPASCPLCATALLPRAEPRPGRWSRAPKP